MSHREKAPPTEYGIARDSGTNDQVYLAQLIAKVEGVANLILTGQDETLERYMDTTPEIMSEEEVDADLEEMGVDSAPTVEAVLETVRANREQHGIRPDGD